MLQVLLYSSLYPQFAVPDPGNANRPAAEQLYLLRPSQRQARVPRVLSPPGARPVDVDAVGSAI